MSGADRKVLQDPGQGDSKVWCLLVCGFDQALDTWTEDGAVSEPKGAYNQT